MKFKSYFKATILVFLILGVGCQNSTNPESESPSVDQMDLATLKALLAEKQTEQRQLEGDIQAIMERMVELDPSVQANQTQRVTTFSARDTVFRQYITAQGLLEADETIQVNAETGGRLINLHIEEGAYVQKGELVAELDLEQLNKQMAELKTSYELATEIYERQKRLWDQNIGSEIQYLQSKNEKERLEKAMESLEFQKTKGSVYAPLAGIVDEILILEGELVSPGAPIAVILDVRQFVATADIAENYLGDINLGEEVTVRFPSLAVETQGRIAFIGSTIDKANRTFRIEVKVNRFVKNLKPNMLVEIQVTTKTIEDVVTVPINSIQQEINGREYLMIVDRSDGAPVAKKTYITKSETNDQVAIVTDGLSEGDEVIEVGGRTVSDGTPLEIIELSVLSADANNQENE